MKIDISYFAFFIGLKATKGSRHRSAIFSGEIFLETWDTEEYFLWHFCLYDFFKNQVYLGFHNDGEDVVTGVWSMDLSDHISSHLQEAESGTVFSPANLCLLELLEPLQTSVQVCNPMGCVYYSKHEVFYALLCSASFSIGKRGYKMYLSIENNCKWLIHSF